MATVPVRPYRRRFHRGRLARADRAGEELADGRAALESGAYTRSDELAIRIPEAELGVVSPCEEANQQPRVTELPVPRRTMPSFPL